MHSRRNGPCGGSRGRGKGPGRRNPTLPQSLLHDAHGIAIVPGVIKVGFVAAGPARLKEFLAKHAGAKAGG